MALRAWQLVNTSRVRHKARRRRPSNRRFFNHGLGDALMIRAILPFIDTPLVLGMPEGRRYDEVFQGFDHVRVELADSAARDYEPIHMFPEDECLPVECGRPIKPRIALEHDFKVFDDDAVIKPLPLDLSRFPRVGVTDTLENIREINGRYVVVNAHGASSPERKDCPVDVAEVICEAILESGSTPVLINYMNDRQYDFADSGRVIQTIGWPCSATALWHLLKNSQAVIAIDSGPLHLALTIPDLPCLFLKRKIDFMRFFYDAGLEGIKKTLPVDSDRHTTRTTIKEFLCLKEPLQKPKLDQ